MMISTKGRYALRVMIDLAESGNDEYISLATIAKRQGLSEKYLESIISVLSKAGYVSALRGKSGGYKLSRKASDYSVGSILKLTEGSLAPVSCLDEGFGCTRASECRSRPLWEGLDRVIDEYLEGFTLADLAVKPEK